MLPEVSPEFVYVAATTLGVLAGAGMEHLAVEQAAQQEEDHYYPALQIALQEEAAETQAKEVSKISRRQMLGQWLSRSAIRSVLPITVAVGFGLVAHSFTSTEKPQKKTAIEISVDDSGATRPVIGQIREVVAQFNNTDAEAIVGNTGQVISMSSRKFGPFTETTDGAPAGEAPLSQQVSLALNRVAESNTKNGKDDGRIVLVTNGNRVGSIKALAEQAKLQHTAIYPVNVERKGTPHSLIDQLKQLADETGGQFRDANSQNFERVAKDVKATTAPEQAPTPQPDRWPERFSGILALFGAGLVYKNRKRMPTGRNAKGE